MDVISEVEQALADVSIGDADVAVESGISRRGTTVKEYDGSINTAFQLCTFVGPLCGEPMMGVCYVVEEVTLDIGEDVDCKIFCAGGLSKVSKGVVWLTFVSFVATKLGLLSGQVISTVKEACRQAFLAYSPRLMLAMYSCDLQAPGLYEGL